MPDPMNEPFDDSIACDECDGNGLIELCERCQDLIEMDHDEAETEYYEGAADPTFVQIEREQRRYRGMFRRRLRHRSGPK